MPKVSVVIPMFNAAATIRRALDSVLAQTERDFEVLVVDDASSDGCGALVEACPDPRVRLIRQPHGFVSAARNRGVREASAGLVSFLDADDEYRPEFLEAILRLLARWPEAGAYACSFSVVDRRGVARAMRFRALPPFPWEGLIPDYFESAIGLQPVCSSAVAVPKRVLEKLGGFREERLPGEDIELWFRIALESPIAFSSVHGAVYHRDVANSLADTLPALDGYILVDTAHKALAEGRVPAGSERFVEGLIDKQLVATAAQLVVAGRGAEARAKLREIRTTFFARDVLYWRLLALLPAAVTRRAAGLKRAVMGRLA
ncbi:MAG: glycosyltransferase family 2 protein [Elusimicrobiota bacterium]|nr:glycosyltransferase family 2 protein [Elusimicrobiota bacterium]